MNWVDFVILLIVALFAVEGLRQGFLAQFFNIIGFLISLIAALALYQQAASLLIKFFNLPQIAANPIGFLSVWLVVESIFFGIFTNFFKKIVSHLSLLAINKYLGFIPAVLNALLFLAFALLFTVSLPIKPDIKKDIFDSKLGALLVRNVTILERPLNEIFGPITKQGLTFLTVKPEEKGSIDLQFTQKEITADFENEKKMFALVNEERVKQGIRPLVWEESLAVVGRKHSRDMFSRGYFSHYSPEGKDVGDRLTEAGISYTLAGENLALAPSLIRAHDGLITSPGHRRNILDPVFGHIGIGAVDGGVYGKMFTQVFTE